MSQLHELAFWIGLCLILSLCLIALSAAHLLRDQPTAQRPARRTPVAGTVDEQLMGVERHLEIATAHLVRRERGLLAPAQQQALLAINELIIAVGYLTTAVRCLRDPDCRTLEGIDRE